MLARFATRSWVIKERCSTTALTIVGLSVREATETRCTRSSLDYLRLEAWIERPVLPLSVTALPTKMVSARRQRYLGRGQRVQQHLP